MPVASTKKLESEQPSRKRLSLKPANLLLALLTATCSTATQATVILTVQTSLPSFYLLDVAPDLNPNSPWLIEVPVTALPRNRPVTPLPVFPIFPTPPLTFEPPSFCQGDACTPGTRPDDWFFPPVCNADLPCPIIPIIYPTPEEIANVPEPGTIGLLATGVALTLTRRFWRRRPDQSTRI